MVIPRSLVATEGFIKCHPAPEDGIAYYHDPHEYRSVLDGQGKGSENYPNQDRGPNGSACVHVVLG